MRAWAVSCGWRSLCMDFLPPSGSLLQGYRRVSRADGHVIFKVRWWLVESISQWSRNFQEAFLLLLTFKNGSNNFGFVRYWMNQRQFFGNDFFYKKFAYSASVKMRSRHSLYAEYRVLAKPNKCFWSRICKIRFKNRELVPTRAACCDCKCKNFPSRKITARFKLNLKTDGLDCKMIFKFGRHIERLHSARKQGRRVYICLFCFAKYLLGAPKPLNCIRWMQAVLSK